MISQVVALETNIRSGTKIAEKEFSVLTELLMIQLLKLDSIEADGQAKVQRKIEVIYNAFPACKTFSFACGISMIIFHQFVQKHEGTCLEFMIC